MTAGENIYDWQKMEFITDYMTSLYVPCVAYGLGGEVMCWIRGPMASASWCFGKLYYFPLQLFAALEAPHIYIK